MARYEDLIDALYAIHSEQDPARKAALLDETVVDDVEFIGLRVQTTGRAAFGEAFAGEGTRIVRTSAVEHRHGWLRCAWQLRDADGDVILTSDGDPYGGLQISRLSEDGRLDLLLPFLGIAPPDR